MDPLAALRLNAGAQIAFSSLLGSLMLLPFQPWLPFYKRISGKAMKEVTAVHLDYYLLAFMQFGAASLLQHHVDLEMGSAKEDAGLIAKLLIFGGWINPTAYAFRAIGINAFALDPTAPLSQNAAALLGGVSATGILIAWLKMFQLYSSYGKHGVSCW